MAGRYGAGLARPEGKSRQSDETARATPRASTFCQEVRKRRGRDKATVRVATLTLGRWGVGLRPRVFGAGILALREP